MLSCPILELNVNTPKAERIGAVLPVINELIAAHELNQLQDGIETFQEKLLERVRKACLADIEWINADAIIPHEDNHTLCCFA